VTRYTRAGADDITVNSPAGFPSSTPRIGQPAGSGGGGLSGVTWLGSDRPWDLLRGTDGAVESLAAATRCLDLIAGSISGLPWKVRRSETETLPVPDWIADPQASRLDGRTVGMDVRGWETRLDPVAWRGQVVTSLLLHGNAFLFVPVRQQGGAPAAPVFILHPDDVELRDGGYHVGEQRMRPGEIIHVRGRGPFDRHGRGRGVLESYADSLGLLHEVTVKASESLNAPVPAGVLEIGSGYAVSTEEAAELRDQWEALHKGRYSVGVLNATTTFKPLSWSNEALELLAMADFGLKQVALAFGLSPSWVGAEDTSLTYSSVPMRAVELRQFGLLTWVRRIESAFDAELPRGTELSITLDGLERGTTAERYAAYETALRSGFATVDEIRSLEGLPPMGQQQEGDAA
jgi:HK97 family phage portal protein